MNKQTEALKLAMEALENLPEMCGIEEAITAIREALAQSRSDEEQPAPGSHLTDEQKAANGLAWLARLEALREEFAGLAKQPAQREPMAQKPYAYEYGVDNGDGTYSIHIDRGSLIHTGVQYEYCVPRNPHPEHPVTPLYTTPPQRTWVGLDNDDLIWIYSNSDKVGQAISNTEAKLKAKNSL